MASFTTIPAELKRQCVQYFDIETLKAFRLVSRTASIICSEELFRTIVLRFNEQSVERFYKVLGSDTLKPMVGSFIIDGEDAQNTNDEDPETRERVEKPWSFAIPKMAQLPSLRGVELRFDRACGLDREWYEQDYDWRTTYQNILFEGLREAALVDTLTIKNMQDACTSRTGSEEAWIAVRSRLKKLALMIVTERKSNFEDAIEKEALHQCFTDELCSHWLEPTQSHLTQLTLYCDNFWGVWPFTDLRGIHFPNLESLALGNWTIAHNWQIDWLTSHGSTLKELILDDCPIVFALWMHFDIADANWPEMRPVNGWDHDGQVTKQFALRWSDVFPIFQDRLFKLQRFGMGHGPWHHSMFDQRYQLPARIESSRYVGFHEGMEDWAEYDGKGYFWGEKEDEYGIKMNIEEPGGKNDTQETDKKDGQALDQFLNAIGYTCAHIEKMKKLQWQNGSKSWQ